LLHGTHAACATGLRELDSELRLSAFKFCGVFEGSGELPLLSGGKKQGVKAAIWER